MAEYVKRSDVLDASKIVYIEYIEVDSEGYEEGDADDIPVVFKRDIEAIPAADVVEVVHGEWLWFEDCSNSGLYCSACHKLIHKVMTPKKKLSNYCPNCGAKMDKT